MRTGSATAIAIYDTTDWTLPTTYLNADGTASFAGAISVDGGTTNENSSYGPGYLIQNRSQGIRNLWTGQLNGSNTSTILADGSATFAEPYKVLLCKHTEDTLEQMHLNESCRRW